MNILLIAGHGNGDSGAVGNGFKECDLTREVVKLLKESLSKYHVKVDIADTNINWHQHIIKNKYYVKFTNYDYVLEVHFNSFKNTPEDDKTTGTEIYVTNVEKATSVERKIVDNISTIGFKNRGVKRVNYDLIYYIRKQGVSSALLEVCFISDIDDMQLYTSNKQQIIDAIAKGIIEGFGIRTKNIESPSDITYCLKDKFFTINEPDKFIHALEVAKNSPELNSLYWGYYKLVNK